MTARPWLKAVAAPALALSLVLAGCAAQPDLDAETGKQLQAEVASARTAFGNGDHAGVLATLDRLAANVEQGAAEGRISQARKAEILDAIALLRADAQAALPPAPAPVTPAPAPQEEPEQDEDQEGKDEPKGGGKDDKKKNEGGKGKD